MTDRLVEAAARSLLQDLPVEQRGGAAVPLCRVGAGDLNAARFELAALVEPTAPQVPDLVVPTVDLHSYDGLFEAELLQEVSP